MQDVLEGLYAVVQQRKAEPQEGSYTCYHLLVMMADQDIPLEAVETVLEERRQKIGNLKQFHVSDHNS